MAKEIKKEVKKEIKKEVKEFMDAPFNFDLMISNIGSKLKMLPLNIERGNLIEDSLSTASLVVDLLIGGGFFSGCMVTLLGKTGSGKSSFCYNSLRNALDWGIPIIFLDIEGSTSPDLLARIIGRPLKEILGVKNDKGEYVIQPLMRYYQPTIGEDTFRFISRVLKSFPDKVEINGKWYLVYDKDQKDKVEGKYKYLKYDGNYYVRAKNGKAQAIVFLDSFASMLPEAKDENDESSGMAKPAQMFSQFMPMIKPKLGPKRVTLVATNQLRINPMQMFGNKEYEVGGEALKYYPDVKIDINEISAQTAGHAKGKGKVWEESTWDGKGIDRYKYSKIFISKNKKFSPFRNSQIRVWLEHKGRSQGGFDPFYDVFKYLEETGQSDITISKSGTITLPGLWTQRKWSYLELKELVLNPNRIEVMRGFELKDSEVKALLKDIKALKGLLANPKMLESEEQIENIKKFVIKEADIKLLLKNDVLGKDGIAVVDKDKEALIVKFEKKVEKMKSDVEQLCAYKLDIRRVCFEQIASNKAFELYFNTLSESSMESSAKVIAKEGKAKSIDFEEGDVCI